MKQDRDMEFIDLDDEEYGPYDDENAYEDYDEEYGAYDEEKFDIRNRNVLKILLPVMLLAVLILVIVLVFLIKGGKQDSGEAALPVMEEMEETAGEGQAQEPESRTEQPPEDPTGAEQESAAEETGKDTGEAGQDASDPQTDHMSTEQGTEVDAAELLSADAAAETAEITLGIDVARYQGTIDWTQTAAAGIDFAMVRVGYRTDGTREICADSNARYNMQEAQKNGIKVGAYFFSTAVSAEEAVEEADWVADYIAQYQITYPVAYDCEGFDKPGSAQYELTKTQRTDIAIAFLKRIYERGYTPMFYASMGELSGEAKWETSRIENTYKVWVSQYPSSPYPQTPKSSYGGSHAMWQYTNQGTVAGIAKPVDVNIAYFGYEGTAEALSDETPEEAQADVEALMNFTEVSEEVTAKESTNLRNIPSQGEDSTVVYTLQNGEILTRTGVSDSGWSRLTYNGQSVYAVSSYLTTDPDYQAPQPAAQEGAGSGDGLKTKFTERNEQVTAKIEVNLRLLPSVTNPDASVAAVLHNGEYATRTGINEDYGWSRVEYNGQTLYCITSYLTQ